MRQEVGDHKGEVIQRKTRRTTQRTDNGALLLGGFPRELVRAARVVLAVGRATLIPARVKADSFWGFQTGASLTPWWRAGGSPCGQGLPFVRTTMRPGFGHWR